MPTYEYRCESCDRTVEAFQGFTDAPLTTCEACGGKLRKVYAPVGIVFKGSGFYKTDSRSSGSKTSSRTASESGGDSGKDPGKDATSPSAPADSGSKPKEPATTASTSSTTPASAPAQAAPSQPARGSD